MLEFLLYIEEDEKEDFKIEAFKSTIMQAFPSKSMYEQLYGEKNEEEWIENMPLDQADEVLDILEILKKVDLANESDIT